MLLISISLAMDSFSVSIVGGLNSQKSKYIDAIKVAGFFGVFQALMPLLGWFIGETLKSFIFTIDHWIAFGLLGIIGLKMIYESFKSGKGKEERDILSNKNLLFMSIATSIDALIVGITLSLIEVPFLLSIITIGIVTFILCFFGFLFGKQLGFLFGKKIEVVGGIILILIGTKILIEHLFL